MNGPMEHGAPVAFRADDAANGSDRWTITRTVLLAWVGFSALFAVLEPPPTAGLPLWQGLLVWLAHIGLGLLLAVGVARVLARSERALHMPPSLFVALSGLLGAALFAPVALGLEAWLPSSPAEAEIDGILDQWESRGGALALAAEFLQMAPSYLLAWMLINAEPLLRRPHVRDARPEPAPRSPEAASTASASDALATAATPDAALDDRAPAGLAARLPPAIGTDLVAVSSDQHYLDVMTTRGSATLLGTLDAVEREYGRVGLRIHRSHWVAIAHVRRVQRTQSGWLCVLSNGRKLPVSRRRWSAVQRRLGKDFAIAPEGTSEHGSSLVSRTP